jgi:putative transposase
MRQRRAYPSDLHDDEWGVLAPLLPSAKPGGRPRTTNLRAVVQAIISLDRTGSQWRALPHDFPPWSTVWRSFRRWRNDGTWQRIHATLRDQVRMAQGRAPTPSAAIIASQAVKTRQKGGCVATMVKGRKRQLLVDTQGWISSMKPTATTIAVGNASSPR